MHDIVCHFNHYSLALLTNYSLFAQNRTPTMSPPESPPVIASRLSPQTATPTRPRRDICDILPAELWLLVKSSIAPWDMVTHVSLFEISASVTDLLYGKGTRRKAFWEAMCLQNGLGVLPNEHPKAVAWEEVALECAMHARIRDHPECGTTRLDVNGVYSVFHGCSCTK